MKVCMLWGPAVSQNLYKLLILLAVQASKRAYKYESQQKIKRTRFFESYVRMGVIDVIVVTGMSGTDRSFRPSHGDLDANLRQ